MTPYTGGVPHDKRAILMLNPAGGSGLELWQYLDKNPLKPSFRIGVNYCKVKSSNLFASVERLRTAGVSMGPEIKTDPAGRGYFFVQDPYGNPIQVYESSCLYSKRKFDLGGVTGCAVGVSDMETSTAFYSEVLGYTERIYDEISDTNQLGWKTSDPIRIRREQLCAPNHSEGRFGQFLGESQIELIQNLNLRPRKIYENRNWGDLGYIHLCFEVYNLNEWVETCHSISPFTVLCDQTLTADEANGKLGYLEDPDGTLIEFVETCRIPILKPLHYYNDLESKSPCLRGW